MSKIRLHFVATIFTICLLLGLSSAARANSINTLSLTSVTWGNQVDVTLGGNHLGLENTAQMNVREVFNDNSFQDVLGYCVAVNQNLVVGGTYGSSYLLNPGSGNPAAQDAAWLVSHYAPGLGNPYNPNSLSTTITALQVAIWEVTYDYSASGNYSLTLGNFSVAGLDSGVSSLATSYLKAMVAADVTQGLNSSGVLVEGTVQPGGVPEPGSMLLLGSATGVLGWWRRRKGQARQDQPAES